MWLLNLKIKILFIFSIDFLFQILAVNSNACSLMPCLNGATCQIQNNGLSYTCSCLDGYSGTNCQTCNNLMF
jgi:hypothetical protein